MYLFSLLGMDHSFRSSAQELKLAQVAGPLQWQYCWSQIMLWWLEIKKKPTLQLNDGSGIQTFWDCNSYSAWLNDQLEKTNLPTPWIPNQDGGGEKINKKTSIDTIKFSKHKTANLWLPSAHSQPVNKLRIPQICMCKHRLEIIPFFFGGRKRETVKGKGFTSM